jgi:hypothetical protein
MVLSSNICKNTMILNSKNTLDKRENLARNAVELRRFVGISRERAACSNQTIPKKKNKNKRTCVF